MKYYKWIEEGLSYEGRNYTYYVNNVERISYSIKNNEITQSYVYFIKDDILYFHWIGTHDNESLRLINTIYKSCNDINIVRGMFTYRYKELLSDNDDKFWKKFCTRKENKYDI